MTSKRIIPCLDVRDARVVKGVNFQGVQDVDDPVSLARYYNGSGADELVFYDITASLESRTVFSDILSRAAAEVSIPLTVGGGIGRIEDFDRALELGAEKVSINSGALKDPGLIDAAARKYGSGRVVLSMDVARVGGKYRVFSKGGREDTGTDALAWARECESRGAGELVLNSIDTDGVQKGFDLDLLSAAAGSVGIPIVASGGAGKMEDFLALFQIPGVAAGLAASIFHSKQVEIARLKAYLHENGVQVRL